jgi:hypothetical protein
VVTRIPSWTGGVQLIREEGGADFLIEDDTGSAKVVNASLKVAAVQDAKYTSGVFHEATPHMEAFLEKHGKASGGKRLRYREAVFEAGETVAIVGEVADEADPEVVPEGGGYRDTPRRLVIRAPAGGSLFASDDPDVV